MVLPTELLRESCKALLAPRDQRDAMAAGGELACELLADAGGRAGDQRH
jgi:hypothetical protein